VQSCRQADPRTYSYGLPAMFVYTW